MLPHLLEALSKYLLPLRMNEEQTSLETQTVENLPATRDTWVLSLGWEDSLEKGMATYSSILA